MHDTLVRALTWALDFDPDPAVLKWPVTVLGAAFFGLLLFAIFQYQTAERRWGLKLVLGLLGFATVVGLGASAFHWVTGVLYGLGYLLTWLVWVLTRRWSWWRRALARGLTAGLTLGPWLWLGATEKCSLVSALRSGVPRGFAHWLLSPNALSGFWLLLGALWMLVLVGGWDCWRWPLAQAGRRRWLLATWTALGLLGLNWYAAGRVDLSGACGKGHHWRLGYVLLSRPGSQWYHGSFADKSLWVVFGGPWGAGLCLEDMQLLWAAKVDSTTALHWAAYGGDAAAIRLLLAAGAHANARDFAGDTPLHVAISKGNHDALAALLSASADANARNKEGETPLHQAALCGRSEAVRLLLAAGAKVNARCRDGRTPLHAAAKHGDATAMRLLLAAGADVQVKNHDGRTPLHVAVGGETPRDVVVSPSENDDESAWIRLLWAAGADVSARDNRDRTPLHVAAGGEAPPDVVVSQSANHDEIERIRLLLAAGANVSARDKDGWTPLHLAARNDNHEAIRLLLAAGAKANERNSEGETALDAATDSTCRELLRKAGALSSDVPRVIPESPPAPNL